MQPARTSWVSVNLLGGVAVLTSYVVGLATMANPGDLWGAIPDAWIVPYTACMPFAAIGYLLMFAYFGWGVDWAHRQGGPSERTVLLVDAATLSAAALWLPLCAVYLSTGHAVWWWAIQAVLMVTALGALGLVWATWRVSPITAPRLRLAAFAGSLAFAWQTVVLDAIVWPRFFGA